MFEKNRAAVVGIGLAAVLLVVLLMRQFGGGTASDLESNDVDKQVAAIGKLERKATPESADTISHYASNKETRVAVRAVYALGRMKSKKHTKTISDILSDKRPKVREAAVVALTQINGRENPKPIVAMLRNDESERVRASAASALGNQHVWVAMPELVKALDDPSLDVRRRAAASVKNMLGADLLYRPDDPREKRLKAIQTIEQVWPGMADAHAAYMRRRSLDKRQMR